MADSLTCRQSLQCSKHAYCPVHGTRRRQTTLLFLVAKQAPLFGLFCLTALVGVRSKHSRHVHATNPSMVGACRHAVLVGILAPRPAIQPSPPYALSSKPKLASPGQTGPSVLETLHATSRLWQHTV